MTRGSVCLPIPSLLSVPLNEAFTRVGRAFSLLLRGTSEEACVLDPGHPRNALLSAQLHTWDAGLALGSGGSWDPRGHSGIEHEFTVHIDSSGKWGCPSTVVGWLHFS